MKVLFAIVILSISLQTITSGRCNKTCKKIQKACWKPKKCHPLAYGNNLGAFNIFMREEKSDYAIDAKEWKKIKKKFKSINRDDDNFALEFFKEQEEYYSNIKKRGKSYLKEIEREMNDGKNRYTEVEEMKEEFSHIIKRGSKSTKEISIEGDGLRGKLLALTSGIDEDPETLGKLLSDNPSNSQTALLLFSPTCSRKCSRNRYNLYYIWNALFNRCWGYFIQDHIYKLPCWKRRMLIRKYLRKLCRARGLKRAIIRLILNYFRYHVRPTICYWKQNY